MEVDELEEDELEEDELPPVSDYYLFSNLSDFH